jgi:hypothetical protein
LKEVKAQAEQGQEAGNSVSVEKSLKFDATASWTVFRRQIETVAEPNCWTRQEISTYLITALQGWDTDLLHGILKDAAYEKTLRSWKTVS